ncbi:MAG: hypothetical protein J6K58_07710 [Lachnospiraceae bacterium]|nr:hypothetical protein [Lachnospiraceae bacterium]
MNIVPWLIAIGVEIVIMCIMQETVWLGIVIITVGFMFHSCFLHGNVQKRKKHKHIFMTGYCFLWGACIVGLYIADRIVGGMDAYEKYAVVIGLGLVLVLFGVSLMAEKLQCRLKKRAVYKETARFYNNTRHTSRYSPVFIYDYEGGHHSCTSWETFSSEEKIRKKFQIGEQYDIYINPKNPQNFVLSRGIEKKAVVIILMGIALIISAL